MEKILVIGTGNDLSLALELCSRDVEVYYYSEWDEKHPRSEFTVGSGFERFGLHCVKDFYSLLKGVAVNDREEWLIFITADGFGDLPDWLKEEGWKVLNPGRLCQILSSDPRFARKFMQERGVDVETFYPYKNLVEVMDNLLNSPLVGLKDQIFEVSGLMLENPLLGTPEELVDKIAKLDKEVVTANIGCVLSEYMDGIPVTLTAFFNGSEFYLPFLVSFDVALNHNPIGSYMMWYKQHPVFARTLGKCADGLKTLGYRGLISLNAKVVYRGIEQGTVIVGCSFNTAPRQPEVRAWVKLVDDLPTLLESVAGGDVYNIKPIRAAAYIMNCTCDDDDSFSNLESLYTFERDAPESFGVSYGQVVMDVEGKVMALPHATDVLQLIGFGETYFESVSNCLTLLEHSSQIADFNYKRNELVQGIRDKIIFIESVI